ncbi:hypothetical protein [Streptomyces cinereoruber]|uniref:hypothetical protein n=1 Tax=Streptomyces cinereoruber TaxID=67260 RepID=UPI003632218D
MPTLHEWITDRVTEAEATAADDPAALRRCEADRRILARHTLATTNAPACDGCGTYGDGDDPATENINDCPELLDLAWAHGITNTVLAGLDRPEAPPRTPPDTATARRAEALHRLRCATPARYAPATFRPAASH